MIIDAHIHIGKRDFIRGDKFNLEYDLFNSYQDTIAMMNNNNIDRAVIFPIPHFQIDPTKSNEYILEAYNCFPDRFIPFCRIDRYLEENLKQKKFFGVKVHFQYENVEINDIKKSLQIIEQARVPLVVHARFSQKVEQIENILKIAPNIIIILAHMGRGHLFTGEQVVENALGLRKYQNVYMDLSTVGDIQAIINCCELIGYERVLFASDYPFGRCYFKKKYNYLNDLKAILNALPDSECEKIMHKNMEQLLSLQYSNQIKVRRAKKTDLTNILLLFESLTEKEKNFLVLNKKYSLIKQIVKSERHCYVAVMSGEIVGFMRESGRPNNYSLLEEIAVSPKYRKQGVATELLLYYHNIYEKTLAKTNSENEKMINLLKKYNYHSNDLEAKKVINWERLGGH